MSDASGPIEEMLRALQTEPWNEKGFPSANLSYSEVLGRRVRSGDWASQRISTVQKIREALEAGDFYEAAALADFFVDEARILYADIYRRWINDINEFLIARGMSYADLLRTNQNILSLLILPDGRPFRARRLWEEFRSEVREFIRLCGAEKRYEANNLLDHFYRSWVSLHDRDVDHIYGLMNEVVARYGELALGEMWEQIIGGLFSFRYAKFDISKLDWKESLPTNLYLAFEAMRGHMVGPGREGNIEFSESEDRFTFRFNPCGSGGHILRGDQEVEGTPSRMTSPYNWGVLQQRHDFAWNKKGICYYCTNCAVVMQLKPIDAFGYPVRVVEPPTYPDQANAKCTWHIFKDPTAVPEEYYTAVGRRKPASFGSARQTKTP